MPAVIPFIPLIASAVGVAGSAILQHKQNKANSNLMNEQRDLADQSTQTGQGFLNQGQQAISPSLNYYTSMLANPREATAPEQNRISSLYAGQANTTRNMYPRGGFGPSAAENLRGQERSAREDVIQQGRPMAAGALSNMGTQLSGLGLQAQGMGAGIYGNVFNQGLNANQQQHQQGAGLGGSLFNAYQSYLLGRSMQQPGSNGNSGMYSGMGTGSYSPSTDNWQGFLGDMGT